MNKTLKKNLLKAMLKVRAFEEKIIEVYPQQDMKTPVHLCIGQEAISAGVSQNLKKNDYVFSTHRNHGHYLAKGANMNLIMAELYGRITGCAKGKGGSMHFVDTKVGCMGTTAIVGGSIPLAVGGALSIKLKKERAKVSVGYFGDGATDEGVFQESLNFAALHSLPVVFICENNFYATNSHQRARQAKDNIYKRAEVYGIYSKRFDGNDVEKVYTESKKAIEMARKGRPVFLEFITYRWKGHVGPECDWEKGCRPKHELFNWMEKCPIKTYSNKLISQRVITKSELEKIQKRLKQEVHKAWKFGKSGKYPNASEIHKDVYI
jgi:acetoin:2,6-dichlorophenolindophenol oxidoreductase subunit alpha